MPEEIVKGPFYSGPLSRTFWAAITALDSRQKDALYAMACQLQELEAQVLTMLLKQYQGQPDAR